MEPTDLTIEILKAIRDEAKETNVRLDQTNLRLDQTNLRLDAARDELSERIVHSELRTATAITELAGTVREVRDVLRTSLELRPRVERCEDDISELKERLDRVAPR
jgi:hypothetical protein